MVVEFSVCFTPWNCRGEVNQMLGTLAKDFIKAVKRNIITNLRALKECDIVEGPSSLQRGQSQVLDCISTSVLQ